MSDETRTFPLLATGYERKEGSAPIMLDGMEVLFERTVGLYPVTLEPKRPGEGSAAALGRRRERLS